VYNESGNPVINSPQIPYGLAGVAGSALKPISLGQVQQFRTLLPESFDIIGVGGISTGRDVLDYLRAGADSVQVGTHYFQNGPRVFSEILQEFVDLVEAEE
jgi:dihydroorotate dehydrogenase (fumarate)